MTLKNSIKIFCVLLLVSCTKSLDELSPNYLLTESNAFTTAAKVDAHISGLHAQWLDYNVGRLSMLVCAYSGITKYKYTYPDPVAFNTNEVFPENGQLKLIYPRFYSIAARATHLIKAMQSDIEIEGMDANRKKEVEAEARVHRALTHFILLRLFGQFWDLNSEYGIAMQLTPSKENNPPPRSTVKETYATILEDLDFGIANAPTSKKEIYRSFGVSRATAKGIKAKVLLHMQDYAGAAQLAKEIMEDGYFGLEAEYGTIFTNAYLSKEFLFSPWKVFSQQETNLTYTGLLKGLADKQVGTDDDGDLTTGEGFDPRFGFNYVKALFPKSSPKLPGTFGNVRVGKYPHKRGSSRESIESTLRMAEIYLIYAEAKARMGSGSDSEALSALNAIRTRAGVDEITPTTKDELLEAIRIEKILELFHEWGEPWYDLVRYHKLGELNITDYRPNIKDDTRLILPIPEIALAANNKINQNPGY